MSDKIRVIVKRPESGYGKSMLIENSASAFSKIVGGGFEFVKIASNLSLVINDTGKLDGLPLNFPLMYKGMPYDYIAGTVIVVQTSGPDCVNLERTFAWWASWIDQVWHDYFDFVSRTEESADFVEDVEFTD